MAEKEKQVLPHFVFARKGRKNHKPIEETPALTPGDIDPFAVQDGKKNAYGIKGPEHKGELILTPQDAQQQTLQSATPLQPRHIERAMQEEVRTIAAGKPVYLKDGEKFFTTVTIKAVLKKENAWKEPEDGNFLSLMELLDTQTLLYINGKDHNLYKRDTFYAYAQFKGKRRSSSSK